MVQDTELLRSELERFGDNLTARLARDEQNLAHHKELMQQQAEQVRRDLDRIEKMLSDHEARIRTVDDATITLNSRVGIFAAGQAFLMLVASAVAAFLGGRS